MNFFTELKSVVESIDSNVIVVMFNATQHDKQTFNYESYPVVKISTNITTSTDLKSGQLIETNNYIVDFVDNDEWDNRTNDDFSEQSGESSFEIYERMKKFGNSVVFKYLTTIKQALTPSPSESSRRFTHSPIWRRGSNFETGASFKFSSKTFGERDC